MTRARRQFLRSLARAAALLAALAMSSVSAARAQSASVIANAPVKDLRLPSFNDDGYRTSLIRAGEARYLSQTQIDVRDLNFAQFAGDGSTTTTNILLAPFATITIPGKNRYLISGKQSVRLIAKDAEATGEDWTYEHEDKRDRGRLIIRKNVRVVINASIEGILN